jgi:transcriptional regulator with XRE-family HTH domain
VERGWNAKGRLTPLYKRFRRRDDLAEITGIDTGTLSGYNSGKRNLGMGNALRIADATGVTLADLGAPTDVQEEDRVRRIVREELAESRELLARILARLQQLRDDGPEAAGTDSDL